MVNLPNLGDKLHVWPAQGLKVQDSKTPISDGGRWMDPEGRDVVWDEFRYGQFLHGEIHLHSPKPAEEKPKASKPEASKPEKKEL
jgi:hypothetical protein